MTELEAKANTKPSVKAPTRAPATPAVRCCDGATIDLQIVWQAVRFEDCDGGHLYNSDAGKLFLNCCDCFFF